jgi:hypothetical protein
VKSLESLDYKDTDKRKRFKKVDHLEFENALYLWFLQDRDQHKIVSNDIICKQAMIFHSVLCIKENYTFVASSSSVNRLKKRRG